MSALANPLLGTTLGIVDLVTIGVVYTVLSRKISKLEAGSSENILSSSKNIEDNSSESNYLELLSKIKQLEMERDILSRKLSQHEVVIVQILREFKERMEKPSHRRTIRQPRILTPSVPISEISDDDDDEARKFLE